MPTIDLDLFAVCATFLASESLEANGFSQRTSLPAAIAMDRCSACRLSGEAMMIAVISFAASML